MKLDATDLNFVMNIAMSSSSKKIMKDHEIMQFVLILNIYGMNKS